MTPSQKCVTSVLPAVILALFFTCLHEQELNSGVLNLLIPTPNTTNDIGYNRDRFLFNPSLKDADSMEMFKFLGILLGVAMRTKKPLDLRLAPMVWKQLAGMIATQEDLQEVDALYVQNLKSICNIHESGVTEQTFAEVSSACPQRIHALFS